MILLKTALKLFLCFRKTELLKNLEPGKPIFWKLEKNTLRVRNLEIWKKKTGNINNFITNFFSSFAQGPHTQRNNGNLNI